MSEKALRRRTPSTNRRLRPSNPPPSRRRTPRNDRRLSRPSERVEILKRCNSEPALSTAGEVDSGEERRDLVAGEEVLYRPMTCTDLFSPMESSHNLSPGKLEGYKKDAKVVINVTVEGCPGPVRTLVKLGANVEETIRLVIGKYSEEGRCPPLDKDSASCFQLHHSHFSLASLNKSDVIGDVGSRSFYLRKCNNDQISNRGRELISASFSSEIILASSDTPPPPDASRFNFLSSLISRTIGKMINSSRKLWKIFGCLQCN